MKIGLLGGSFNPIHNGHIKLIIYLLKNKIVDQVWILPCKKICNKKSIDIKFRLKMIKIAVKNIKNAKICDIELKSKDNYTINTVRKLKKKYNHKFFFIIGSDILQNIKNWHKFNDIKKEMNFIVFNRKKYPVKNIGINIYKIINDEFKDISSINIRNLIKNKKSIKNFVPKNVESYIIKNKLY